MSEKRNSADRAISLAKNDLIFIDFDGTISVKDTGIAVIDALELEEAWEIEHQWRRGEIDSMECLTRQWEMVDLPRGAIYRMIDSFALDEGFNDLAEAAIQIGAGLVVVSDGLDFYVDRMLGRLGWEICPGEQVINRPRHCIPRFANHGRVTDHGVEISFPHQSPDCDQCGNCKTAHLQRLRPHFSRLIYIGDGHSDLCAARFADLVFAKDALAEDFAQSGRPFVNFQSLTEINKVLLAAYKR
jgi:2-hydroxy-3-keto-5-methylthiopentenyl-1-phosphate phosphatase